MLLWGVENCGALDAIGGGKISVGPPYFEAVFVPLMAPALFLMGIGPLARLKHVSLPELAVLLRWALATSLVLGLLLPLALGTWKPMVGFGLALAIKKRLNEHGRKARNHGTSRDFNKGVAA